MKTLVVNMEALRFGKRIGSEVRFRKIESANGRHVTTCLISTDRNEEGRFTRYFSDTATLGKRDAIEKRYDFIAGCRISLNRALARSLGHGLDREVAGKLRHAIQLELSIIENDRNGREAAKKLDALVRQRDFLLGEKDKLVWKLLVPMFAEVMANIECVSAARREAMDIMSQKVASRPVALDEPHEQYTPETCPGRPCGSECDHLGVPPNFPCVPLPPDEEGAGLPSGRASGLE